MARAWRNALELCGLLLAISTPAASQRPTTPTGQFIVRIGKDTIAVERFTRDGSALTGQISQRDGSRSDYSLVLRRDGAIDRIDHTRSGAEGSASFTFAFSDSTVTYLDEQGRALQEVRTSARPFPFLLNSAALAETVLRASRLPVGQTMNWIGVRLVLRDTVSMRLARISADSVVLSGPQGDLRFGVSPSGDVVGGTYTRGKWIFERTGPATKP